MRAMSARGREKRDVGPMRGEAELPAVAEMLAWSFGQSVPDSEAWARRSGIERFRVLRDGGRPIACLLLVQMGQFFGGERVAMGGVAGVASAADRRGQGAVRELMRATVNELAAGGVPLSTLYPATRTLYRDAGYEPAGSRFIVRVPVARIGVRDRGLPVRPITDADEAIVVETYRKKARLNNGHLDRTDYIWNRVRTPRDQNSRGFLIGGPAAVEGYLYVHERPTDDPPHHDLRLTDAVALTPAAGRRLLTFLSDHRSMAEHAFWSSGPNDVLLQMLPEVGYDMELPMGHWMLRITDVLGALESRGYLPGVEVEVHLEVRDEVVSANAGRFVLSVAGGHGQVRRGGRGLVKMDVRGLAPLYSGHLSPASLTAAGLIEGRASEIAALTLAFAGGAPWMVDGF